MKHFLTVLMTCLLLLTAGAASAADTPLLQIHFAGAQRIGADPESVALGPIFNCPEAKVLISQTLDKLARFPRVWLKDCLPPNAENGTGLLRPLLDDLTVSEWYLSAHDYGHVKPDFALAIRLGAGRDRLWQQNLSTLVSDWLQVQPQSIAGGSAWKVPGSTVTVRLEQLQGWMIFSAGQNPTPLSRQLLAGNQGPWLTMDADWAQIARRWPDLEWADLPATHLEVSGHQKDLVLTARALFSGPVTGPLPAWQIPEKAIRSQFVSFTAARGFAPWLQQQGWYQPYAINPTPDEAFVWAAPGIPFATLAAVPCLSAQSAMEQAYAHLQTTFESLNAKNYFITKINPVQTNGQVSFSSLPPFIAPFFKPWQEAAGQFLLAGLFPEGGRPQPFPAALHSQLDQPNLVYFHWEVTAQRIPEFLQVSQLSLALSKHKQLPSDSAAFKWINRIAPSLGNSVTAISESRPNELALTRTASAGFTAVELYALGDWLEATNFPGCDLKLPAHGPLKFRHHPPGALPSGPGAPASPLSVPLPH